MSAQQKAKEEAVKASQAADKRREITFKSGRSDRERDRDRDGGRRDHRGDDRYRYDKRPREWSKR